MTTGTAPTSAAMAWMADAFCGQRPDLPWTFDADQVGTWDRLIMTALCARCPVRDACGEYAAAVGANGGFWAGSHRDTDTPACSVALVAGPPPWVADMLPGLSALAGAA